MSTTIAEDDVRLTTEVVEVHQTTESTALSGVTTDEIPPEFSLLY